MITERGIYQLTEDFDIHHFNVKKTLKAGSRVEVVDMDKTVKDAVYANNLKCWVPSNIPVQPYKPSESKTTSLGYMNGWGGDVPPIVKQCRQKNHTLSQENVGRCLNQYTCHICGYSYMVDSSD
jgi:hypothetical protein